MPIDMPIDMPKTTQANMPINQIVRIAADEWRYWLRSHLVLGGVLVFLTLVFTTSIITAIHIDAETHARMHQQQQAEATFFAQPDRHPHRMVHYGHYIFRAPAPLAIFDPGLDSVTGQSIFLEGHRQNTAMFAESSASTDIGGFANLTPALVYQLFAPLIIILLGHGALVRERESGLLASLLSLGITGNTLILGKALAIVVFTMMLLLPLIVSCFFAIAAGETLATALVMFAVHALYLMLWCFIALGCSALVRERGTALVALAGLWLVMSLVLPSVAVNIASKSAPIAGKIETDLAMLTDLRKLGDGHHAGDPAFAQLRASLLEKYNVERIEQLPVNFRGLVAMDAEQKLTKVLNDYAEARMAGEIQQEKLLEKFAWLSPTLAISFASRSVAGTDLLHYHRFQREAEALRFSFVQGLNRAHAEELSYQDDINRNKDDASWQRARVGSANWQVLDAYQFQAASLTERVNQAFSVLQILFVWLVLMLAGLWWCGGRIKP